jgi:subtilisin family serine protease
MILAAILLLGVPSSPVEAQSGRARRVLVGMRPMAAPSQLQTFRGKHGMRVRKTLTRGQILVMDVPQGQSEASFTSQLLTDPAVAFVEPDGMIYPALTPNDPEYSKQYHLPLVRAPEAWEATTGNANVVIAVVDTGCDLDHPDLAGRIFTNRNEIPNNGVDDDRNGLVDDVHGWDFENNTNNANPEPDGVDNNSDGTPDEQVSHGTLVAGLAAGIGNNGFGTAGIAWNVTILPIQVFPDDGGATVSQVIEGIDYAVEMGADVINLSIGGGYYSSFTAPIKAAYDAGIVVVAAAGNGGNELRDGQSSWESPVCNDGVLGVDNHVIGVGSTDANDLRASFSNYDGSSWSTFVDCVAPGEGMYGPGFYAPGFPDFSSYFTSNTGTSFSVPLVSGLAALILSRNPAMSPDQVSRAIQAGCDNIDGLNPGFAGKLGAGRINCARALGVQLPPRAARDLTAADTVGDDGGSVTLTWQLSLDDGAGADNVTQYIIRRRQGTSGSFVEIGRVVAGKTSYIDQAVTDGVAYYYVVRTTDGSLTSDSAIAGPATPQNDGAPAPPSNFFAEDRPTDQGGAIVVGWDRYTAPADFDHFAIYRARTRFTSIASMQPLARVTSATAVQYVDTTTTDGTDYWYAIAAVDTFGNRATTVAAVGPVQSFANGTVTLQAGMHFFSSPLEPADHDPATLLDIPAAQIKLARWFPAGNQYVIYSGGSSLPLTLGHGYWLKLAEPVTFEPEGSMAPSGSLSVSLVRGWQQVGNPYFAAMNAGAATVNYEGTTMDLPSADAANIMRQVFWRYNRQTNSYTLVAPFLGIGDARINPWEGFWVRVEKPCALILPRPGTVATAGVSQPAAAEPDGWFTKLSVRGEGGVDSDNFFGVSGQLAAMGPLESPPPTEDGVDLSFVDTAGRRVAGRFSAVEARELEWDLMIEGTPGSRLEVWCPAPQEIPSGWAVTLQDQATGSAVDVRRGGRYALTLAPGESQRPMRLRLTRTGGALTLSGMSAVASRAGGAEMTFTLSAPAACTVKVLNIAGRTVRVLRQGTPMPAGASQVLWDGRSDAGLAVPSGTYVLQVEAVTDDGNRTQAVRTLAVQR